MLRNKKVLSGQDLEEFVRRKDRAVIYFLKLDGKVIYVGQTIDIINRVRQHYKDKEFNEVEYWQADKDKLDFIESYYIIKYSPSLNKDMPIKPEHMGLVRERDLPEFVTEKEKRFVIRSRGINYYDITNLVEVMKEELNNGY